MELLTRATFENAEMHAKTSFFFLRSPTGRGGGRRGQGKRRGEGRDVAIFFNGAPGCNAREQQTPFQERYRGERNRCTHRAFSRVHNSLARVQWRHHLVQGGENIVFLYSLLDNKEIRLWIIDIAFDRKSEEFLIFRSGLRAMNRSKFSKKKVSEIFSTKKIDIKRD